MMSLGKRSLKLQQTIMYHTRHLVSSKWLIYLLVKITKSICQIVRMNLKSLDKWISFLARNEICIV